MLAASTEPIRMSGKPMPIPAVNCSLSSARPSTTAIAGFT
jgi:hypothetical protein